MTKSCYLEHGLKIQNGVQASDELYHYGIKGMKWGIRRTPEQLGHRTKTSAKVASAAKSAGSAVVRGAKKAGSAVATSVKNRRAAKKQKKAEEREVERTKKLKKKKVSDMTDQELRDRIARLQLEQQYKQLAPQTTNKGKSWVRRALEGAAESSMKNLAEQAFDTLGGESINRIAAAMAGYDNPNDPSKRVVNPRKRQSAKK